MNKYFLMALVILGLRINIVNAMEPVGTGSYATMTRPYPLLLFREAMQRGDEEIAFSLLNVIVDPVLSALVFGTDCNDGHRTKLLIDPRYLAIARNTGCKKVEQKLLLLNSKESCVEINFDYA